jgi:type IV pilus assembly protein PilY1
MNWTLGYTDDTGANRCPNSADPTQCAALGDIVRSTPTIVDRPSADVEDETYDVFASSNAGRYMMTYVSSNDGIFHGFASSPNQTGDIIAGSALNENFAFIPPAVLPKLKSQYPASRVRLLDGYAVTQDVVATTHPLPPSPYPFLLERGKTDVAGQENTWRTILVQGFGGPQPGFFALDITDTQRPMDTGVTGPQFLWQLTTSSGGDQLFGTGGQPIITSVNLGGKETAVAILPGGLGGSPVPGTCNRANPTRTSTWTDTHYDPLITLPAFEPRSEISCYDPADRAARSLTVVRLDSGEIIRRFTRLADEGAAGLTGVFAGTSGTEPWLDSPITGEPAAYPNGPGLIADRVFVGDQDGTMWRVDVSLPDPEDWTMQLFFDAYSVRRGSATGYAEGKPIITAPMLSVDARGQITVAFGTGDQDISGSSLDYQYIYSLTEAENATGSAFAAKVNWYLPLGGAHILGPMTLLGGVLYFTTVDATAATICQSAPSSIWGLDYLTPYNFADLSEGGQWRLQRATDTAPVNNIAASTIIDDAGGSGTSNTVFGISLEYVPSCSDRSTGSSEYINGTRTSVTNADPADLKLVFQTGTGDTSQEALGFTTGFEAVTLAPPKTASTILSWSAILD